MNDCIKNLKGNRIPVEELTNYYIYALWDDEEIVYIGQSVQLESRIRSHIRNKDFTHYSFYECKSAFEMDLMESNLIFKLKPKYNKTLGNGYVSLEKLRGKIRKINENLKYNKEFYVNKIREKLEKSDFELVDFRGTTSIKKEDELDVMRFLIGGYYE